MRVDRLHLKAFGCFSNVVLDLSGPEHGLFVLYGPNEAGKSLALEGLRQWLYEIDRSVPLEFKHKKPKQRVGGIVSSNGQRLCCFRKRGNANTLLDEDDKRIGDDALGPFLQGIDEGRFRTIFGINHFRLRAGGQEIAAGKGDLGQALFAAGAGLLRLDRILKRLQEAKAKLFAVNAEKPAINSCLLRCKDIEGRLAKERLSLAEFTENQETLANLHRNREELQERLSELLQKQNNVDRLIRVTPLVQRRARLLTQLRELEGAVRLRANFRSDFQKIETRLLLDCQSLNDLQEQIKTCNAELAQVPADPEILAEKELLQQVSTWAGTYATDTQDLPGLKTQRNQIQGEAKQQLRALGREPSLEPEKIEPLRCDEQTRNRIRVLGTQRAEHVANARNADERVGKLELDLEASESDLQQLPVPVDTEGLAATLRRITKMGDLESGVSAERVNLADQDRALAEALSRLSLWSGPPEEVPSVPIPGPQTIDHHRDLLEKAARKLEDAGRRVSEHRARLTEVTKQLERFRQVGEVPSEEQLEAERAGRQRGWCLIRSAWLNGRRDESAEQEWIATVAPARSLADAYDVAVTRSDQTADRLRREANRVTDYANLLAEQDATRQNLAVTEQERQEAKAGLRAADDAWKAVWTPAGIDPWSPREMRVWLDQWQRQVDRTKERQTQADRLALKTQQLQGAVAELRSALASSGGLTSSLRSAPSLSELLELAEERIKDVAAVHQQRAAGDEAVKRLRRQLAEARRALETAERAKAEWEQQWDANLRFLEPKQRLSPDEANRVLDTILEFWKKISDLKNRQSRIEGIEKRSGGFPQAVSELAERLEGKRAGGEDSLRVHERLQVRLREAESNEDRRCQKAEECGKLLGKIDEKKQSIRVLEQQLRRLCQEAAVEDADKLPEGIRCSDEIRDVETKLQECESDLQLQGGMADLENLCRLVEEAVREQRDYALEKRTLEQQFEEKQAGLDDVNKRIGATEEAGRALRARSGAGESAAELESEYARLRDHLEEYSSLVLASHALNEAIRRYREGTSTGLLAEASSIFALLTCGSFERLTISEEEEGKPYLVGVRPDGSEVGVEGMSDGTCDQLYLALRLAHLKRHVKKDGPFPFIVDDILLTFDNDRARAALRCLAELGRCTQVLLFTHHCHLRDMAGEEEFGGHIHIRNLA
jgi:uncharacterized protein YhaN